MSPWRAAGPRIKRDIVGVRGALSLETRHAARLYLFEFIVVFYNPQHDYAALGPRTPVEFAATLNP